MEIGEIRNEPVPPHIAIESKDDISNLPKSGRNVPIVIFGDAIDMTPATIVKLIRKETQNQQILYVTRRSLESDDRITFFISGGYGIITADDIGPHEANEKYPLLLRKKMRVSTPERQPNEIFEHRPFPDFFIDTLHSTVNIAGRQVELTRVEFRIIAILCTFPEKVVQRSVFHEKIAEDVSVHSLTTHLYRINKKIAPYHIDPERVGDSEVYRLFRSE